MPRLSRLLAPAALLSGLLLAGCGTAPPQTILAPRTDVPATLLTCSPAPAPPVVLATDGQLGTFILDLAQAGQDCRDKLAAVKGIVTP